MGLGFGVWGFRVKVLGLGFRDRDLNPKSIDLNPKAYTYPIPQNPIP